MAEWIEPDEFWRRGPAVLAPLEARGFARRTDLEEISPTGATLVYVGRHVAFTFSFDVRDQCVDGYVSRVKGGQLFEEDGGYSSRIYGHLVRHAHYRGSPQGADWDPEAHASEPWLECALAGTLNLLRTAGAELLEDRPESLPGSS
jgi:hypothetical protein